MTHCDKHQHQPSLGLLQRLEGSAMLLQLLIIRCQKYEAKVEDYVA